MERCISAVPASLLMQRVQAFRAITWVGLLAEAHDIAAAAVQLGPEKSPFICSKLSAVGYWECLRFMEDWGSAASGAFHIS